MTFQEIALPHFDSLYSFALAVGSEGQEAEDLVQETFLRAYKKFDQFDYGTNIKAWMFRILRNIAIDRMREIRFTPSVAGLNDPNEPETTDTDERESERTTRK